MPVQELFGGAITLCVPPTYFDVSKIRQIPDNQEVWLERDSDASLIVELVETPVDLEDRDAFSKYKMVKFYFDQLALDNSARRKLVIGMRKDLPVPTGISIGDPQASVELMEGQQSIAKFNTDDFVDVHIWLFVVRLPRAKSDLLITWNDPEGKIGEQQIIDTLASLVLSDWDLFTCTA